MYGRTKLAGEARSRRFGAASDFSHCLGVCDEGRNFLLTILRLATQREEIRIVRDQIGAPTLNSEIARATAQILEQIYKRPDEQRHGQNAVAPIT